MAEKLLQIVNLHARVEDKNILNGINLTINKGEIHVLMGPNWCGKSTLMNLIMNNPRYTKTNGDIIFEGENINDLQVDERAKKGIFMSFQSPYEVSGVNLENFIRTAKTSISDEKVTLLKFRRELRSKMDELKINQDYADRYVNVGFSGGEKKKAEVLQMSMLNPKLAMLDETDSGLDVDAVRIVSEGVRKYHNDENSVLIITHHKEILQTIVPDYVHVLIDGKIALTGGSELIEKIENEGYAWIKRRPKMDKRKKTQLEELDRGIYDIKNEVKYKTKLDKGLNEDIVRKISKEKNEPQWVLDIRLKALDLFNNMNNPEWAPNLSEVDINKLTTYISPDAKMSTDWGEVPEDIKDTFDKLGIPEAEKNNALSGVGAQYDSEVVYHSIQDYLKKQGVVYLDFDSAVKEYEEIVKEYFTAVLKPNDHKYLALHYAVFSGGSFVYVPKGVKVDIPLQSYFRLNAPGAGQFEHTLIIVEEDAYCHFIEGCSAPKYNVINVHAGAVELYVKKGATLRYSTIENWSRNMYNLNSKRALVEENAKIEWVSGSFGSKVSMLYPTSVLKGNGAKSEFTGITFAGKDQHLDTGAVAIHLAPNTSSTIMSKSISKNGGIAIYRGVVKVAKNAYNSKSTTTCESLMLDNISRSDTIPVIDIQNQKVDLGHEAKIGRIDDEVIYYLMSRGISEQEAKAMVVRGFAEPIAKELPLEYAVEMNNLINLELEGTIG